LRQSVNKITEHRIQSSSLSAKPAALRCFSALPQKLIAAFTDEFRWKVEKTLYVVASLMRPDSFWDFGAL